MDGAIRLSLSLPEWYFSTILTPFAAGPLTAIPALGTASLVVGIILSLLTRDRRLLLFLIPAGLSQLLVAIAGAFERQLSDPWLGPLLLMFLAAQLLMSLYLIYKLEEVRRAASALSVFSFTYALFSAFVAAMAFSGDWL